MKTLIIITLLALSASASAFASEDWTCYKDGKEVFKADFVEAKFFDDLHFSSVKLTQSKNNGNELTGSFKQGHDDFDYIVTFNPDQTIRVQKFFFMDGYGYNETEEVLTCRVRYC